MFSPDAAPRLRASKAELKTYTAEVLNILGTITVTVSYKDQAVDLNLLMVAGDGPSLLGRDWLNHINLDWPRLNHVQATSACQQILDKHDSIFKDELGTVQGVTAKFHINPDAQLNFFKSTPSAVCLSGQGRRRAQSTPNCWCHKTSKIFRIGRPNCSSD